MGSQGLHKTLSPLLVTSRLPRDALAAAGTPLQKAQEAQSGPAVRHRGCGWPGSWSGRGRWFSGFGEEIRSGSQEK